MSRHILVVEDETELAALVRDYLISAGHKVVTLANGAEALEHIRRQPPQLVVLDIMLPGMDGLAVCRAVRAFSHVPIIMVTARVEEIDRLLGLESGADDYLCKPFSPRELVARVKAVLRRTSNLPPENPVDIDEHGMRVAVRGTRLDLTPTEFRLLATLLKHPGQVFSRAMLLDKANPDGLDVTDRAIDSHIKNLRRKLAPFYPEAELIQSVYGVGYRLDFPEDDK